jgi:8-oxo-dGTP pyrophosphatase MutT (NUDIX family)
MPLERSAGAIIFRKEGEEPLFLLLHYPREARRGEPYWDFPKGHIEERETEGKAMRREVIEETGIRDLKIIPKFREVIKYFFKWQGKTIFKMVVFYLVETENKEVKISSEHMGYKWLPYNEATEQLTFRNAKEILKKANDFLSRKSIQGGEKNS